MGDLILAHNPFENGDKFVKWLEHFHHQTIILNVKEDGLECEIVELLRDKGISDYFFLDQPFPTVRKSALAGIRTSIRLSEYENPPNLNDLPVNWLWLDCYSGNWDYLARHSEILQNSELKTCVVSPELQGREIDSEPQRISEIFKNLEISLDAVCTKSPERWQGLVL